MTNRILLSLTSQPSPRNQVEQAGGFILHPRSVASGAIQGSGLVLLLFRLYARNVFNVIRSSDPSLFTRGNKIVFNFRNGALGCTIAEMTQEPASEWMMKVSTEKRSILCYMCNVSGERLKNRIQLILIGMKIHDLGLNYPFRFHS